MALVPCKVCGSLNSDQAEICLSCGYPPEGRKRPAIFQWAALLVVALLAVPLVMSVLSRLQPEPRQLPQEAPAAQAPPSLAPAGPASRG